MGLCCMCQLRTSLVSAVAGAVLAPALPAVAVGAAATGELGGATRLLPRLAGGTLLLALVAAGLLSLGVYSPVFTNG